MSTQREILEQLKRDELLSAVDRFELSVGDRRVRDQLIEVLASSLKTRLPEVLVDLKRDRLKELCRSLGLDDGGRAKAVIVERLLSEAPKGASSFRRSAQSSQRPSLYEMGPATRKLVEALAERNRRRRAAGKGEQDALRAPASKQEPLPSKHKALDAKGLENWRPPPSEPTILSRGKKFHTQVQAEWSDVKGAAPEVSLRDMKNRRRRIDILVDEGEDWVSIIEIKRTAWDRIRPDRVRPNVLRHARQLWRYIEPYIERMGRDVCPGIIYENVPKTPGRVEQIEEALHERAIQVVWQTESMKELRERLKHISRSGGYG